MVGAIFKRHVVVLPLAFTLPLRVALASRPPDAATLVATGGGGAATSARLCPLPATTVMGRSPLRKALVLTNTGAVL